MSSKHIYKHLVPSLVATTFLILAACQGTSQDINSRTAKIGEKTQTEGLLKTKADAELKGYALDATSLPAYKELVGPNLKKLGATVNSSWEKLFNIKNWYMGPGKIASDKLPSPIAGTIDDNSDYIIQQTPGDVFIDADLFGKQNQADQGKMILREYLTAIYTIKNLSDGDLCLLMKEVYEVKECARHAQGEKLSDSLEESTEETVDVELGTSELVDKKATPAATPKVRQKANAEKVLTREDYNKIEKIAKYIETQSSSVLNALTVIREMKANGFNTKIFDYKLALDASAAAADATTAAQSTESASQAGGTNKEEAQSVSTALFNTLRPQIEEASTRSLGCTFPGVENKESIPCKIHLTDETQGNKLALLLGMSIKFDDKAIDNTSVFTVNTETVPYKKFIDQNAEYAVFQVWSKKLENPAVGSKYRGTFLLAKKGIVNSAEVLELQAVVSVPGIVTSIQQDEATKKTLCAGKADVDGTFEKMAAIVSVHGAAISSDVVGLLNPAAPCY